MDFKAGRVVDSLWPEVGAVAGFILSKEVVRYIKENYGLTGWKNPEYWLDVAAISIPGYMIGADTAGVNEATAIMWTELGFLGRRLGDNLYNRMDLTKKAKARGAAKLAVKNRGKGNAVDQAAQIATAREIALELRSKTPAGVSGYTEI